MYRPRIQVPGLSLDLPDVEEAWKLERLIQGFWRAFAEAAVCLHFFDQELGRPWWGPFTTAEWEAWDAGCRPPTYPLDDQPAAYQSVLMFLYARNFVFSLDTIRRTLIALTKRYADPRLQSLRAEWDSTFPGLKGLRDTAHHDDDRIQGLGRWGQPIPPERDDDPWGLPPDGINIESLNGRILGSTGEDGRHHSLEISEQSLRAAAELIERVVACFPWKYEPQIQPNDSNPRGTPPRI